MIKVLDKHVADKIAAGEVIDRPVSIVKELVENSLDADATSITVEIRGGGKDYIRITDDGCGIASEDVELAFTRHATSKISSEADLDAIGTLGFRGEALASVCAVARVEMITRTADENAGRSVILEGGSLISNRPTGCPTGTTITVKDLFFNVPARQKFLASDASESRRITDMLSRIALSYPDVRFRLINGGKDVFNTTGSGNILENILRIYGQDLKDSLLPVDMARDDMIVRGYVSVPTITSSSRNRQFFCVNGRVVSSKTVERGLEKAYKQRLFAGRYPLAFLFISIPANSLDVNVHPTKKEIRFDEPFVVEELVENAVKQALSGGESVPRVDVEARGKEIEAGVIPASEHGSEVKDPGASAIVDDTSATNVDEPPEDEVDVKDLLETLRSEVKEEQIAIDVENKPSTGDSPGASVDIGSLDIIGIALNTYILATDHDSLFLIDQHAAHERIIFERFLKEYKEADTAAQRLLVPLQVSVSADLETVRDVWTQQLVGMGYDIAPFGDRIYIVREFPALLNEEEAENFLRQFLIELEEKPDSSDFAALERIIMRSCKAAIKGGDKLHPEEARALLDQLKECDNPYSCPHGRPTLVKMTKYDLERMFKRA